MIFDRGGLDLQLIRQWPEKWVSLGVMEWVSFSRKERKVRKGCKLETRNSKLETDQSTGKTFCRRGTMHGEEGAGES